MFGSGCSNSNSVVAISALLEAVGGNRDDAGRKKARTCTQIADRTLKGVHGIRALRRYAESRRPEALARVGVALAALSRRRRERHDVHQSDTEHAAFPNRCVLSRWFGTDQAGLHQALNARLSSAVAERRWLLLILSQEASDRIDHASGSCGSGHALALIVSPQSRSDHAALVR